MKLLFVLMLICGNAFGTSMSDVPANVKLTPDMERLITDNFGNRPEDFGKAEARDVLQDILQESETLTGPFEFGPNGKPVYRYDLETKRPPLIMPKIPLERPDELKGCVTRTKTTCTGTGKDKVCETESWEVCIGT